MSTSEREFEMVEKSFEDVCWSPEREDVEQWAEEQSRKDFDEKFETACMDGSMDKLFEEVMSNMSSTELAEIVSELVVV